VVLATVLLLTNVAVANGDHTEFGQEISSTAQQLGGNVTKGNQFVAKAASRHKHRERSTKR
jgi:hypothetical protein